MEKSKLVIGAVLWIATSLVQFGVFTQRMNAVEAQLSEVRQDIRTMQATLMAK